MNLEENNIFDKTNNKGTLAGNSAFRINRINTSLLY